MYFLKIDDDIFSATFSGKMIDKDWDDRESKTITFSNLSQNAVESILYDGVEWHIYSPHTVMKPVLDENGDEVLDENDEPMVVQVDVSEDYDNSAFSIRGPITIYPDGRVSVKMGKPTDLEQAYELLYGGIE